MYDVIVVGARVAGSPTAMMFARMGYRVLLVDRSRFPSDTISTNYIHQPGVARLARWGVLDAVVGSGTPAIDRTVYRMGDLLLEGGVSGYEGVKLAYAPRRYVLDAILLAAAEEAGSEVREGCPLAGLVFSEGRVVGVSLSSPSGGIVEERARLIIGADGMRSAVARMVGASITIENPRMTCAYYSYWGLAAGFELYEGPQSWVGAVPTNDATLIAAYFPQDQFQAVRSAAWKHYRDAIRVTAPQLEERLTGTEPLDRLWGTGDQRNFFRRAQGPGWALVGDAGHHKDSISARGITDAFVQAELLVERVGAVLTDPSALDLSLARYEADRDALMMDGYQATLTVAKLESQAKRMNLLRVIASDPVLTETYFDTVAGIKSIQALYSPELMAIAESSVPAT